MAEATSDDELVRLAQRGDERAFASLCARHYGLMFKVAWQWCGRREDAEDIAQDAAIRMARGLASYRFDAAFTTWVYRLVINTAKDYYRTKNRHAVHEVALDDDMPVAGGAQTPEEKMQSDDLLRAVNRLPDALKEVVLLVHWHGLSHKQAAEVLKCAEGTISWRVHEARKQLNENLQTGKGMRSHG